MNYASVIQNVSFLLWISGPYTQFFLEKRKVREHSTATLTRLAKLILILNVFNFNRNHYRQVGGVAMGSKMDPNYGCLFVGFVEHQMFHQYNGFIPQLYRRYIDGVCGRRCLLCTGRPRELRRLNFHGDLPFLDIKLSISEEKITT